MSRVYRCLVCASTPAWRVERHGDAVVTWACDEHLAQVCHSLQRSFEHSTLTVGEARLP